MNPLTDVKTRPDRSADGQGSAEGLSPDEAVDRAGRITERVQAEARELERVRDFRAAAGLCAQVAEAWRQAAALASGDRQRYCQSLADYWAERADATRRRAKEKVEAVAPARLPVAGPMLPAARGTPPKPITRPLSPAGIRPDDDAREPKGIAPPRETSQPKDKKPLFRR